MMFGIRIGEVNIDRVVINHVDEHHHHGRPHFALTIGPISEQKEGPKVPLTLQITDSQGFDISVTDGVDKKGNPAPIQGDVAFAVDDDSILELSNVGGRSAHVKAVGALGVAVITLTADADVSDEGVSNIEDSVTVNVVAGQAVSFGISASTPSEEP